MVKESVTTFTCFCKVVFELSRDEMVVLILSILVWFDTNMPLLAYRENMLARKAKAKGNNGHRFGFLSADLGMFSQCIIALTNIPARANQNPKEEKNENMIS
jgi:hypothetical protein